MKRTVVLVLLLILSIPARSQAEVGCQVVKFEARKNISIKELGELASPQSVDGAVGTIVFYPFDDEDRPEARGLEEVGVLVVSRGTLGETPLGGVVWSSGNVAFRKAAAALQTPSLVSVELVPETGKRGCTSDHMLVSLKSPATVYVNGVRVGSAKDVK